MSRSERYRDGSYEEKLSGLDGWVRDLVDEGKFACRDAAIDGLVKDYEKRFLRNASPTERFVLDAIVTGVKLSMPESEVVQLVTQSMSPFLPRRWANRKAMRSLRSAMNGLGVCSNIHLFGLDETMEEWGDDAKPKPSPAGVVGAIKDVLFSMVGSAVRSVPVPVLFFRRR